MSRFIICITLLATCSLLNGNAEKFIVVIPTRQIRRTPTTLPARPSVRATSYLKLPPFNSYGQVRPGASLPPNNQLSNGITEFEHIQGGRNHAVTPYGKGYNYAPYARGYLPYDKKGGLVPSINQNSRFPTEPSTKLRQQAGPVYGPTPSASGYYHRLINNDPYLTDKHSPTRLQPVDRLPHSTFTGQRQPIDNEDLSISQRQVPQTSASYNHPKVGPILVTPNSSSSQQEATRAGDLLRESSNAVSKVPPPTTIGAGKGGIVLRDTILLDDYEKQIAEFTKSWPKLSAFPGAFGSASSFFPGSSLNPSLSSGVSRSSDSLSTSNSIGRQGYAVKEEIDEPPIDFRTMPIITSPLHAYPTPTTSALFRNFG